MMTIRSGSHDDIVQTQSRQISPSKATVRVQVLAAVNVVLAIFVTVVLTLDYRRSLAEQVDHKRIALDEEAIAMLPAVVQMWHNDRGGVQRYIDAVCGRMRDTRSPGHHIAVISGADVLQASAHQSATPELLRAMRQAATATNHRARLGKIEVVVGTHSDNGVTIYISERTDNVYRSVVGNIVRRLAGFVVLAFVAGGAINIALALIVTRPLGQLVDTVKEIGKGKLGVQSDSFRSEELDYLAREVNAMSESLALADRDRRTQMTVAREIQEHLLPDQTSIPGLRIASLFQPADDVGGDYYDVRALPGGAWLFCVADVTGHGVPAAMSASMLKTLVMQATEQFAAPAQMLDFINHVLTAVNRPGDFVSMFLARLSPETGCLDYASAGHEPAWFVSRRGHTTELSSTGTLLGIDEDNTWNDVQIVLMEGDRLLIVTDGLSEARSSTGEMFGRTRLVALLAGCQELSLKQTAARIEQNLRTFRRDATQDDDVTLLLLEMCGGKSEESTKC